MFIRTFYSAFKVLTGFRKQTNKPLLFQFFHLTQNLNHNWLLPLLASPSSLKANQFPNLVSFSFFPVRYVFFSFPILSLVQDPINGYILWKKHFIHSISLCQSPVTIILWTVKMIQIGSLIRKTAPCFFTYKDRHRAFVKIIR